MKRFLLIAAMTVSVACWMMPCNVQAHGRFGHRLRAVARVPLRLARAPIRLVRTIGQHRCDCGAACDCLAACYCDPVASSLDLTKCATGTCVAK